MTSAVLLVLTYSKSALVTSSMTQCLTVTKSDYGNVKISKPVKKVTENTLLDKLSTISLAVTNSSIISALLVAPQLSISFWFDGRYNEPVMLANGHL